MTAHDSAAKTYKTLNDAGRSHDECLREAVRAAFDDAAKTIEATDPWTNWPIWTIASYIRALSDGGQKND